ncbi:MAG TPA: MmcQ/YjbR family DNA-binding protein [Rhizomicrobium sp.]|nr:MmcQ/YjbR family DNA-binding protein [Rhizomicrobium sp.]
MKLARRTLALKAFLEARPGATASPMTSSTGKTPLVLIFKVAGKTFAILSVRTEEFVILKCDSHLADGLRGRYSGVGHRSHLDRRHWISVALNSDVPAAEIRRLASLSYDLVCAGLTKKQQAQIAALAR